MLEHVQILLGDIVLAGDLALPESARGVVLFAHGSGSSRLSPRNVQVAQVLQRARVGTLLFDLLTPLEDRYYTNRFEIGLLAARLVAATAWLCERLGASPMNLGYFGASTGAAAALCAAADGGDAIAAVVSRGGRPDLAGAALPRVKSPTLLLVGGHDFDVIELNRAAFEQLHCEKAMHIVPGATHLFEEPGTLDEVAKQACSWFTHHFGGNA